MEAVGLTGLAAVIIPFLVGLLKKIPWVGTKHAPVAAFVCGIVFGAIAYAVGLAPEGATLMQMLVQGAIAGGVSTGLYSLAKNVGVKPK